ncbi:MAG: hypothetical protein ACRDF4_00700 [Rhabdochlamydiaceae bacterium]
MARPRRQQEIAFFLCNNPELTKSPSEIARSIKCSPIEAKLALSRLRKKLGGHIDAERLCPQCLTHSRFLDVCCSCGTEIPTAKAANTCDLEDTSVTKQQDHEICNRIGEAFTSRCPIKLDIKTLEFLKRDRDPEQRLRTYCLSRVANLLKQYSSVDPLASNEAALCTSKAVREFCELNKDLKRVERSDKLAIVTKALLLCMDNLPQYNRMWKDAIYRLVTYPTVILYGE